MLKLCVGCDTVEELLDWRRATRVSGQPWVLRTRQTPKRSADLLDGGSLYRVYKGFILSRQTILEIRTVGLGAAKRCEITLDEEVIRTEPAPRRAFQGWRYLDPADAPDDLVAAGREPALPSALARKLRDLGAW